MIAVVKCECLGKGKVRVIFDNGMTCLLYRGEARQLQIEEGAVLAEEQYQQMMTEVLGKRAKKRALHLLEQMDRTEYKLREKLKTGGYPQECIDAAVEYVKHFHYLDDGRYTSNFIRCSQEKMSRGKIRQKLLERGVNRELIDRILESEYEGEETEQICELLRKRHFDSESADQREFSRTYQFLMRRGFQSSEVLKCMKCLDR